MMPPRKLLVLALALLCPGLVAAAEPPAAAAPPQAESAPPAADKVAETAADDEVSVEDIRVFTAVFREVQRSYVEPVSAEQLMKSAIRGLLLDLDPHSAYLRKDDLQALTDDTSGRYGGLGIEVQVRAGVLTVIAPIDDTPAARAGIQPGDVISRIDGIPVESENADVAIDRMRGEAGTEVKITVIRAGQPAFDLTLVREVIDVTAVRGRLLAPGFGYVRIAAFQTNTAEELAKRIAALIEPGKPLDGLVLDLRSNPGGLLDAAVDVSDLFLDTGVIVSTKGRVALSSAEFEAQPGDVLKGAPLVVLVDGGSASASEIVAGALQDRRRALILGQRTFGKGSVQSVLPLASGEAIKLTTALYYTPSGRSIQAEGIEPDVLLQAAELRPLGDTERVSEADLPGHLGNGNGDNAEPESEATTAVVPASDPKRDFVLSEALNILRALARWGAR
ncbi:MAG: S41 family peptidase [Rhodanobacteraceae bacterium]|nr:S41 family peptidase [Rhodanobacteraceae bacterium]